MGPLLTNGIISSEWSYLVALLIGIGFGFVLEQAGFSSTRKLAGVFYGYDFVVLRVFFTAAVTAMVGLLFMNYFGWLDLSLIYINPLYLWSGIVGGVIMGFGFIMGGFCPGTGLCAAAIGKIDAMAFVGGIFIGVLIFGEAFPVFEGLYNGSYLGDLMVYDSLGLTQKTFAMFLIAMALIAFFVTGKIEKLVNAKPGDAAVNWFGISRKYVAPATLLLLMGIAFMFLPVKRNQSVELKPEALLAELQTTDRFLPMDEVLARTMAGDSSLRLIDVRPAAEFATFSLPGAINIPAQEVLAYEWNEIVNQHGKSNVFFSNGIIAADEAWALCRRMGYANNYVLQGGLNAFVEQVLHHETIYGESDEYISPDHEQVHLLKAYFLDSARKNGGQTVIKMKKREKAAGGC